MSTAARALRALNPFQSDPDLPLTQRQPARVANADAKPGTTQGRAPGDYAQSAGAWAVEYHTKAQIARKCRRIAARWQKKIGKVDAIERELEGVPEETQPKWLRTLEPLFASTGVLVLAVCGAGIIAEGLGTLPTLSVWESTLGEHGQLPALALAIGVAYQLAGHVAGWFIHLAQHAGRHARIALLAGAAALLITAVWAIVAVSDGRHVNGAATAKVQEAGALSSQANEQRREANRLEQAARARRSGRTPAAPPARAVELRAQAASNDARATELRSQGMRERTLDFFTAVQVLTLIVSTAAGWGFSASSVLRLRRRARRLRAKADKLYVKGLGKALVIGNLGLQTIALVASRTGQGTAYTPRDMGWLQQAYLEVLGGRADLAPTSAGLPTPPSAAISDPLGTATPQQEVVVTARAARSRRTPTYRAASYRSAALRHGDARRRSAADNAVLNGAGTDATPAA